MEARKSILADIMSANGTTVESIVEKIYDSEKDRETGLKQLKEVLEYREVNKNLVKKFAEAAGGTQQEVEDFLNDVIYYCKTIKEGLDKERNEKVAEAVARVHEEMDAKVKEEIETKIYKQGTAWMDAQLAEKAAKKAESKPKKVKTTATEEAAPLPEETPIAGDSEADPFN